MSLLDKIAGEAQAEERSTTPLLDHLVGEEADGLRCWITLWERRQTAGVPREVDAEALQTRSGRTAGGPSGKRWAAAMAREGSRGLRT
jgi:hypothetical protein